MSWSRRGVLALSLLPLAGCFKPMLAEDGTARRLRGRIAYPDVDDRFGYFLNESLEDRLGRPAEPDFRLEILTTIAESGIAVAQDNTVTRLTLIATANWKLYRNGDPTPVLTDTASNQSGYNATTSVYATRQTRLDVERRLARDLGERIARVVLARADRITS